MNQDLLNIIQNITTKIYTTLNSAKEQISQAKTKLETAQAEATAKASTICVSIYDSCKKKTCSNFLCNWVSWVSDNSCELACNATKSAYIKSVSVLEFAKTTLKATQEAMGSLAKAAEFIMNNTVTVFNIIYARFNLIMNADNKDEFNAGILVDVNMVLLGKSYVRNIVFVFNDIEGIKQALMDEATAIIKTIFSSI